MFFGKKAQRISRILIVEDEPLVAFDNEYALQQAGYAIVATVDRFRDADAIISAQGQIDLVVTDIRLRGERSGVELARHAYALQIPVIFATASCPDEARDGGLALGLLSKPFQSRTLVRAIAVCEAVLAGRDPGRLPPELTLFANQQG